jgi:hypothetical protein
MRLFHRVLNTDWEIEWQWRKLRGHGSPIALGWEYGVYTELNTPTTTQDIGTGWRKRMRLAKNGGLRSENDITDDNHGFTGWLKGGEKYKKVET